jgi:hypothetical protein
VIVETRARDLKVGDVIKTETMWPDSDWCPITQIRTSRTGWTLFFRGSYDRGPDKRPLKTYRTCREVTIVQRRVDD